jgi:hypothetical protein
MKSNLFWGLLGLNAVLMFMLAGNFRTATAQAQIRRPAEYLLIPCQMQQGLTEAVFIVDVSNGMLGAMAYDDGNRQLDVQPPINLTTVFNSATPSR